MPEQRGQPTVGPEGARLDRADRHVKPRGDLGMSESLEVSQADELPLVVGKLVERAPYLPDLVRGLDPDRTGDQLGSGRIDLFETDADRPPYLAAVDVDRRPPGDRGQPRSQLAADVEAPRRAPGREEGLLGGLLGQAAFAEQLERDRVNEPSVALVHDADAVRVAGRELRSEVGFSRCDHRSLAFITQLEHARSASLRVCFSAPGSRRASFSRRYTALPPNRFSVSLRRDPRPRRKTWS